jgi:hypothetical protein
VTGCCEHDYELSDSDKDRDFWLAWLLLDSCIWGSHYSGYEDFCLLVYSVVCKLTDVSEEHIPYSGSKNKVKIKGTKQAISGIDSHQTARRYIS